MEQFILLPVRLDLFDGAAAAGGDGGGTGGTTATAEGTSSATSGEAQTQSPDAEGNAQQQTPADLEREFKELVSGRFKDQYTKATQSMIDKRFKASKATESLLQAHKPLVDALSTRYDIADGDLGKILQAVQADKTYEQEAAENAGMTLEQHRQVKQFRADSYRYQQALKQNQAQQQAQQQYQSWVAEGEAVKQAYPDFDIRQELTNPQFQGMLKSGVPMQHAYEVMHLSDIKTATATAAEKKVTDNIKAKGARPPENGTANSGGGVLQNDVSKMTRKERAEIARKVARGEQITF